MEDITIPKTVIHAAKHLVDMYGKNFVLIGNKDGRDVYKYKFPEDSRTGFPFVFLYDKEKDTVAKITGFDALDIICEFIKE